MAQEPQTQDSPAMTGTGTDGLYRRDKTVYMTACDGYGIPGLESALSALMERGGLLDLMKERPGLTVGIKANLVAAMKPGTAATVHPEVITTVCRLLRKAGAARVIVGDSPGGVYNQATLSAVYHALGLPQTDDDGGQVNHNYEVKNALFPGARVLKSFTYTAWLDECDLIVDLCKLKSHGMMGMTCACKNMFGVIPGTTKPEYHFRFPNLPDFADMLVDLNDYFAPKVALCLVDAIDTMEGNGPTQGHVRHCGLLAASVNPHALDLACARVIGLDVKTVPTLAAAAARGYIPRSASQLDIRYIGDVPGMELPDGPTVPGFETVAVRHSLTFDSRGKLFGKIAGAALHSRPDPNESRCIGCGKCVRMCPASAISLAEVRKKKKSDAPVRRVARIDTGKCIRCFCCQEFCPIGAITVYRTPIARLLTPGAGKK